MKYGKTSMGLHAMPQNCIGAAMLLFVLHPCALAAQHPVRTYSRAAKPPSTWHVSRTPVLEIGGVDGRGPTEFNRIEGAARLSDGSVAVGDGGTPEVRLFTASGTFSRLLLGKGRGPNELDVLDRIFAVGDTLLVMEGFHAVHVVRPGVEARRVVLGPVKNYLRGVAWGALGARKLVTQLQSEGADESTRKPLARFDTISYAAIALVDSSARVIASLPNPPRFSLEAGRAPTYPIGFAPHPHFTSVPGRFCIGFSARYDITCHDSLGRVMFQIQRNVPQGRVTEGARQAFRDAQAGIRSDGSSRYAGQLLEHRKRVAAAARFAAVYPAFSQLLLARSGELWVRAFAMEDGVNTSSLRSNTTPSHWSIYDLTGQWVADCTLPARFAPLDIGRDYVLGVSKDEDDIERVTMYALNR